MKTFFSRVVSGLKWVGVHFVDIFTDLPKLIKASHEIANDASTLIPDIALVLSDCEKLVAAGVEDSGMAITAVESLVAAILLAVAARGVNVIEDLAVVKAFDAFVADVSNKKNFSDVLSAYAVLVKDFDALKTTIETDIAAIESDISKA